MTTVGIEDFDKAVKDLRDAFFKQKLKKRGKCTAKLIRILQKTGYEDISKTSKAIIRKFEYKNSHDFKKMSEHVKDFNYKESEAFKMVNNCFSEDGMEITCKGLKEIIDFFIDEEKKQGRELIIDREAYRKKEALYLFINNNLDIFRPHFQNSVIRKKNN